MLFVIRILVILLPSLLLFSWWVAGEGMGSLEIFRIVGREVKHKITNI
jgi:hypothetical protein